MSKQLRALWPAWFPYPCNWVRALLVALLLGLVGVSVRLAGFWGLVIAVASDRILPLIVLGGLGLLAPFLLVAYVHHMIWGKSPTRWPQWLPSPPSLAAGLTALIVMFLATLLSLLALMPFLVPLLDCWVYAGKFACRRLTESQISFATAMWLVSAAYLYQYDYLVRRRSTNRYRQKVTPTPSKPTALTPPIDPIEAELNQLRGELGLLRMNRNSKQKT